MSQWCDMRSNRSSLDTGFDTQKGKKQKTKKQKTNNEHKTHAHHSETRSCQYGYILQHKIAPYISRHLLDNADWIQIHDLIINDYSSRIATHVSSWKMHVCDKIFNADK